MPQVDIKLTSAADTGGVDAMQTRIQEFERGVARAGDEYERLGRKLERKFSLPDLGYDLMRSFGIGSAAALVEHFFKLFEEGANVAESKAKRVGEELKKVEEIANRLIEKREKNFIDTLAPEDRVARAKERIELLTSKIEESKKKQAELETYATSYDPHIHMDEAGTIADHQKASDEARGEAAAQLKFLSEIEDRKAEIAEAEKKMGEEDKKRTEERSRSMREALTDEERGFSELLANQREKNAKSDEEIKKRQEQARTYRELGDAGAKFAREVDEINKLESQGTLTAKDAAAARAKLKADLDDLAGKTIRQAREEIEKYDIALAKVDKNPALSDQEKAQQRVKLLDDQTDAIKRINKELGAFMAAHPGVDVAGITSAMQSFGDKGAKNAGREEPRQTLAQRDQISLRDTGDPSKHYQSAGDGMAGALIQQFGEIGTAGDQIARTFSAVGSSIRSSMANAFESMVTTSGSARSKIVAFGNAIGLSFIQNGAKMVADWIYQHAVMTTIRRVFHITDVAETTGAEATKTAVTGAGTGARILMTMKETGASLIQAGIKAMTAVANIPYVGPFLAIAALGAVIAAGAKVMKGFAAGGVVDGGKQPIWINENGTESVLNARATSMLGRGAVDALNSGQMIPQLTAPAFQPAIGGGTAARAAGGDTADSRQHQIAFVDHRDSNALEHLQRDPRYETHFVHMMQKHRGKVGVRW